MQNREAEQRSAYLRNSEVLQEISHICMLDNSVNLSSSQNTIERTISLQSVCKCVCVRGISLVQIKNWIVSERNSRRIYQEISGIFDCNFRPLRFSFTKTFCVHFRIQIFLHHIWRRERNTWIHAIFLPPTDSIS